ncbi:hypothetical protein [Tsuneonella mangrovi]|uniref:hypothetical protein n=1 Tax=Tsuneonella mangrovi TaxID=1982042 RepID=UPI000BA21322|nr:hypothetical protein [Tsuneonella mangrovi]
MSFADKIVGALVDRVCFGVAHFQLGLTKEDDSFTLTSSADILLDNESGDFRDADAPAGLTSLVGKHIASIDLDKVPSSARVSFAEGPTFTAVWPEKIYDNLFIVRVDGTEDWGVIG